MSALRHLQRLCGDLGVVIQAGRLITTAIDAIVVAEAASRIEAELRDLQAEPDLEETRERLLANTASATVWAWRVAARLGGVRA